MSVFQKALVLVVVVEWGEGRWLLQFNNCHCEASVPNTEITDLVFADDATIFAESLEFPVMCLEALHKEVKPLGQNS